MLQQTLVRYLFRAAVVAICPSGRFRVNSERVPHCPGISAQKFSDSKGQSGTYLGNEFDVRVGFPLLTRLHAEIGGGYFTPGDFVKKQAPTFGDTIFGYIQLTVHLLEAYESA